MQRYKQISTLQTILRKSDTFTSLSLFENGQQYYIRGYALESLGYLKEAKKNYKASKRIGYHDATQALNALNEKIKAQKKGK